MIFLAVILNFVISCQKDDNEITIYQPIITEIIPTEGPVNSIVAIIGKRFSVDPKINVVQCDDINLKILEVKPDTIWVRIPQGAKSGKISVVVSDVEESNPAVSPIEFTVLQPAISQYIPSSGIPGDTIQVKGKFFNPGSSDFALTINGMTFGQILEKSDTSLTIRVGQKITTGRLSLKTFGQSVTGPVFVIRPNITSFNPQTIPEQSSLTVRGTNFSLTPRVRIGGVLAPNQLVSDTLIKVTVPKLLKEDETEKITDVVVIADGNESNPITVKVLVSDAPVIYSLSPDTGDTGQEVVIEGDNFGTQPANLSVEFTGTGASRVPATVLEVTDTQLKVKVPAGVNSGFIYLTLNGSTAIGGPFTVPFNYTTILPSIIWEGSIITVVGSRFPFTASEITISFTLNEANGGGNIEVPALSVNATQDRFTTQVPKGTKNNSPIKVIINGIELSKEDIRITITKPSPQTVTPSVAPIGSVVAIEGFGFSNVDVDNKVFFSGSGGILIPAIVQSGAQYGRMQVEVPLGATEGNIYVKVLESTQIKGPVFKVGTPPPTIYLAGPSQGLMRVTFNAEDKPVVDKIFTEKAVEVLVHEGENKIFARTSDNKLWMADIVSGNTFTWKQIYKNATTVTKNMTSLAVSGTNLYWISRTTPSGVIVRGNTSGTGTPQIVYNQATGFIMDNPAFTAKVSVFNESDLIWISIGTDENIMRSNGAYDITLGAAAGEVASVEVLYEPEELLTAARFGQLAPDDPDVTSASSLVNELDVDINGDIYYCHGIPVPNPSSTQTFPKIFRGNVNGTSPLVEIKNDQIADKAAIRSIEIVGNKIFGIMEGRLIDAGGSEDDVVFSMNKDGSNFIVLYRIPNNANIYQSIAIDEP